MNISHIELQLHKRLAYPYVWPGRQNDAYDHLTNFIYTSGEFEYIFDHINSVFLGETNAQAKYDYALNRWFNYWSSQAIEQIFSESNRVIPAINRRDRTTDFTIDGVKFDHKTSVFPKEYARPLKYAQEHPGDLIQWLYLNQSQQQRKHLKNRLFWCCMLMMGNTGSLKLR